MKKIVVLISGNGTNLQALIDQCHLTEQIQIGLVISSKATAYGLQRAVKAGIPTLTHSLKDYKQNGATRLQFDLDLANIVKKQQPDLVVLAGWMLILSAEFLEAVKPHRLINLHPALPGQYNGTNAIQRAYQAYQKNSLIVTKSGVMVHDVIAQVDMGSVVALEEVQFINEESLESFEERMHEAERRVIVQAVRNILLQF